MMNDYENLEKLLDESPMGDYAMYTKEDLVEFAQLAIEEAIYCVDIPMAERNTIRLMMGMIDQMESPKARDIGLVTTTDWTK
jgi:hypothetical protein